MRAGWKDRLVKGAAPALFAALLLTSAPLSFAGDSAAPLPGGSTAGNGATAAPAPYSPPRPKVGLALGGGGTRGVAHVAVLKVLKEEGIPVDFICGTSIGAIVGGLYSAGVPLDTIEEKLVDRSLMKSFLTVPVVVRVAVAPVLVLPRLFGSHPYDGLYRGNRFRKYINKSVPGPSHKIEDFPIPFNAVALNLIDGKAHRITEGDLGYAVQASSAVPSLRKPVQIGEKLFVDGGVVANLPVSQCREMGAEFVIAVDVDETFGPVPLDTFRKVGSVPTRLLNLQLNMVDKPQLELADAVIHPDVDGIGLLSTKVSDARKALSAGHEAARQAAPAIKEKLEAYRLSRQSASDGSRQSASDGSRQ